MLAYLHSDQSRYCTKTIVKGGANFSASGKCVLRVRRFTSRTELSGEKIRELAEHSKCHFVMITTILIVTSITRIGCLGLLAGFDPCEPCMFDKNCNSESKVPIVRNLFQALGKYQFIRYECMYLELTDSTQILGTQ